MNSHSTGSSHWPPRQGEAAAHLGLAALIAISALVFFATFATAAASRAPGEVYLTIHSSTQAFPASIRHVITIVLENANLATALQQGPFEEYLATHYGFASHYYAACHPSAPNYLAITSGDTLQCGTDAYQVHAQTNIADLVQAAGLTWGAYEESMPTPCYTTDSGDYIAHHDPFVSYADIVANASRCDAHVLPLSAWNSSVAAGAIPNYAFITPNVMDDGHDTDVAYADHWLRGWLGPLLNESLFRSSVFFIVYDESKTLNTGFQGFDGGPVYLAAVGPDVIPNLTYAANVTDYNLLTTTEWLLGLGSLGHDDNWTDFPPLKSLFRLDSSTPPPTVYRLAGEVTLSNGSPVAAATVDVNSSTNTTSAFTNATGGFNISLPNGSYVVTADSIGGRTNPLNLTVAGAPLLNLTLSIPPQVYTFHGTILNRSSGAPIPNATVLLNFSAAPSQETSSATGNFTELLPAGTYVITISATHYQTRNSTAVVGPSNLTAIYGLEPIDTPIYPVQVTIALANESAPVLNATIVVAIPNGSESFLAQNGSAEFSLPNGTYEAVVEAPGLAPAVLQITVNGASETAVHVTLDNLTIGPSGPLGIGTVAIVTLASGALVVLLAPGWLGFASTARRWSPFCCRRNRRR
ncbi:MAG: carboxypeptidase regulatory-like domain-containing protein [Thermoplasmata archaeon]